MLREALPSLLYHGTVHRLSKSLQNAVGSVCFCLESKSFAVQGESKTLTPPPLLFFSLFFLKVMFRVAFLCTK